ncbi:MAG: (Fe-S)-binding protein [Actinobacteria bacterium]|nr:(Fe-S)-binding protein [Actinomycetota bacterium]
MPEPRPELPVVADDVAAAAVHGSFCPKMCTFACPVTAATGRDDAVPWSFHRTVSDLAAGRVATDAHAAGHLEACSGCLACRVPCVFDQDVPAQVRAGRAATRAAGSPVRGTEEAVAAVASGRSPYGADRDVEPPRSGTVARTDADVVVVAGCRDDAGDLDALTRLLEAAGRVPTVVVPEGCCGAALADLGAPAEAAAATARLAGRLPDVPLVVATDPHCLPSLRAATGADATVTDVASALAGLLAEGVLRLAGEAVRVAFHDPCLLARAEAVTRPPRLLLAAAGAEVVEPEGHGATTVCSGAGLALELVAPDDARATGEHRARQLTATGVPVVTACAGARRRLADAGVDVRDLASFLAERLPPEPAA